MWPAKFMRIGVITYWATSNNYGQVLQCYALQRALISLGHRPYIIRFNPFAKLPTLGERLRGMNAAKLLSVITGQRKKDKAQLAYITKKDFQRDFDSFRSNYLNLSPRIYSSLAELRSDSPVADIYVCGSDQVWHNSLADPETAAWFLDFGTVQKRVAYAASIGRTIKDKEIKKFSYYLSKFSSISLRESDATDFCRSIGFKDAQTVLDPTLLLEAADYPVCRTQAGDDSGNYLFAYIVNVTERDALIWNEVGRYSAERGLSVRPVYSSGYRTCVEFLSDEYPSEWPTVPQWLSMICNSDCVVTTSFHGVALSILMHKPFLSIPLGGKKASANSRVHTLLHSLGLSNRILDNGADFAEKMDSPIDWADVDARLATLRADSRRFLELALCEVDRNA